MTNRIKPVSTRAAYISDVGCVRSHNEDALYCGDGLWLIADGMGGHAKGEVASNLAVEAVVQNFNASGDLIYAIEQAQRKIRVTCELCLDSRFMGTTIVALCCRALAYEIAWVGDSRAYLWDGEKQVLKQLTTDHSLVMDMVAKGLLSREQAAQHPKRHVLTRCLGIKALEAMDIGHIRGVWQPKQQILLCSDGLSDEIDSVLLSALFAEQSDKQTLVQRLLSVAKVAGGHDNISAILVDSAV